MKELIARLRKLEAAATPGPWAIAIESGELWLMDADYIKSIGSDEDLEFIAELRNAWPKILGSFGKGG